MKWGSLCIELSQSTYNCTYIHTYIFTYIQCRGGGWGWPWWLLTIRWPPHFPFTFSLKTDVPWRGLLWESETSPPSNKRRFVFSASLGWTWPSRHCRPTWGPWSPWQCGQSWRQWCSWWSWSWRESNVWFVKSNLAVCHCVQCCSLSWSLVVLTTLRTENNRDNLGWRMSL